MLDEWESFRRPPDVLVSHSSKPRSKDYAASVQENLRELFPDILILKSSDALSGGRRFLSSEVRNCLPAPQLQTPGSVAFALV